MRSDFPVSPNPSRDRTLKCRVRQSSAASGENVQRLSSVGKSVSAGRNRSIASSSFSEVGNSSTANSPVERSRSARPSPETAAMKLFVVSSSNPSSVTVPGVTMRVTSRRTSPFASFGSSTWSQSAAVFPARISFARYAFRAWCGTPHIGWSPRCVRVAPSIGAATIASSPNIS